MLQERLWLKVDRVSSRCRRLRWWRMAAMFWLIAAVIAVALWGLAVATGWVVTTSVAAWVAVGLSGLVFARLALSSRIDACEVARQIESLFPELNSCLLAAMEQRPEGADGRLGFLQESVIRQALDHATTHDWRQVVPLRSIVRAAAVQFVALGLFLIAVMNVGQWSQGFSDLARIESKSVDNLPPGVKFTVEVEPGDAEVERGTNLLVLARVTGELPPEATLVIQQEGSATSKDDTTSKLGMSRSLEDPVFGGRIAAVTQPFAYHIELGEQRTPTFRVTVFEYPRLERADARLVYPSYTGLEEKRVQDVRTVSVVEGTQVTIICHLNKHVRSARFVEAKRGAEKGDDESPNVAELVRVQDSGATKALNSHEFNYEVTLTADRSRRLKLELIDESGRRNVEAFEFSLNVLPNNPPTLKLVQPARDLEVSPLEELDVKATAWDDFGLKRLGLTFAIAGQPATDVVLGENAAAREKHELANAIKFEELQAEPDQLLSYHFWAEDFGPDGNVRRTASDMFFAEVRHFEEIFRQGQPPPGGQQQQAQGENAQTAQQLANSQKDIINATWKVIRRESESTAVARALTKASDPASKAADSASLARRVSEAFTGDVEQIAQSQQALLEKSQGLAEKLKDAQSLEHLEAVLTAMRQAIERLTAAHAESSAEPLAPALAAEQAAYQALLKLRAREHEIIKQQQQSNSSSSSASARSQQQRQQMDQLDLKQDENRYETERLAQQKQESEADRETRQVLNRLRELAQRQHDLNERLKDLQTALQEAATPDRREEIKQQLKRLQDEQRQVLRDTDELQSRMESAANQEQMSAERQQLEQTREDVRRAAESLEKEQVTQATAAGRRAEEQFDQLRDEFRRRASNRFNEEVREMRDAARDLDREQKELSQKLAEVTQPDAPKETPKDAPMGASKDKPKAAGPKSLREDHRAEVIVRGLNEQKEKLSGLTERMKQTVQEAEQTEPLLSERLYDAARNVEQQKVDQALEVTSRSLQRGLNEDARQVERIAGQGITNLREGVEKAAEAVLGDETESLRRAREALRQLSQELNREIAQNAPQLAPNGEQPGESNPSDQPNAESKSDQQPTPNGQQSSDAKSNLPGKPDQSKSDTKSPQSESGQPQSGDRQQAESGKTPGQQQGQQSQSQQSGQQPGQQRGQQQGQRGQQPGQQAGQSGLGQSQQGETKSDDPKPGQSSLNESGQQPGQQQSGQQQSGQRSPGQRSGQRGQQRLSGPNESTGGGAFENQGVEQHSSPITGEDFVKWSDRLRDVEEMVDDPALRAEAARIRDQARAARAEFKRHSKEPNWPLIQANVAVPLAELTNRVAEELLRHNSHKAIVPLDRDPVPPKFTEKTRRYYERLGSGK